MERWTQLLCRLLHFVMKLQVSKFASTQICMSFLCKDLLIDTKKLTGIYLFDNCRDGFRQNGMFALLPHIP